MAHQHAQKSKSPDSVGDALHAGATSIAEAGSDIYTAAVGQARDATDQVDKYVRHNPWYAIGVAAGAGFLLGLLVRRR
jgi:ElaB/YqjD/DUF883 family membrane-anchored ribosome-binding protein